MNKAELLDKISNLEQAVEGFEGADKVINRNKIRQLKIKVEGMALNDIEDKLSQIQLPSLNEMNTSIQSAADAIEAQQNRVAAFDKAFGIIKGALGVVV